MSENKKEKIEMNIWRNFFMYLKPYKVEFIKLSLLMILLGILDSIFPLLDKYAIDNLIGESTIDGLSVYAILYLLVIGLLSLTVYLFIYYGSIIENKMAYDIRKLGFDKLQNLSLSYYDDQALGWIMARMTSDINRLSATISWSLVDISWGFSTMFFVSIFMFKLNVKLALLTIAVVPILALVSSWFQKKILRTQRSIREVNSKITAAYNEDIQGAQTSKTLLREELNLSEFQALTEEMKRKSIKSTLISAFYLPLVLSLSSIATALSLNFGGNLVLEKTISYGSLLAFIHYSSLFFQPIRQLAVIISEFQGAQASAERVFQLLNEEEEIIDEVNLVFQPDNMPKIKGKIEFKNVSFSYKNGGKVLNKVNFKVNPGETIALVGSTGSGKSTIVNLISRFYQTDEGEILIDDINYRRAPQSWIHSNLGYVLQDPHLFSGTIMDNIRYGKLEASDDEVIQAAKLVKAHNFIIKMEDGYQTKVGESGGLLSTGEKQLISLARALIGDPSLFILDEATSSIDTKTEATIQQAIDQVLENRTAFIIAHRLSTIRNADRIFVIDNGEIIEEGSHEKLIARKKAYYNLYSNQFNN